jgi:hypothetical protein
VDTPFRVRFYINQWERIVGISGYLDVWHSHNGGWRRYTDNSDEVYEDRGVLFCINSVDVGYVQDDETTRIMDPFDPLADWVTPNANIVERRAWTVPSATWPGSGGDGSTNDVEVEFCLTIPSERVRIGDTIELFVFFQDVDFEALGADAYIQWPTITVAGAADKALRLKGDALQLKGSSLIIK